METLLETSRFWRAYVPHEQEHWNARRVVHLHRRAGFAATWTEIQRDLHDGPQASIERVLAGRSVTLGVPAEFQQTANLLGESAASSGDAARLKAWWIYRMLFGPDPLTERLVLMWHNHFATSNLKVQNLAAIHNQNRHFRELNRAPFGRLLERAVRDPALLVWLDAPANRRGHANENLARELMELFTLGIGNYTESDVREAARALTGWSVNEEGSFEEVPARHDDGEKVLFGRRGRWTGSDLVRMLLEHPATGRRLAVRLCELLMGEAAAPSPPTPLPLRTGGEGRTSAPVPQNQRPEGRNGASIPSPPYSGERGRGEGAVDAAMIQGLAEGLRRHDLDVGWGMATVLRSRAFFDERNLGRRILGPVEFVVGAARALEMFDPPPSTLLLAEWIARLGQDLFYPPNVGGWPAGRAWLTTRSAIGRANYAAALVAGDPIGRPAFDALGLARRHGQGTDLDSALTFYTKLFLGIEPTAAWRTRLLQAVGPRSDKAESARRLVALILASPEAQLA
jgi:Protein of unknown function (DUF1800)